MELKITFVIAKRNTLPVIDRKVNAATDDLGNQCANWFILRQEARPGCAPETLRSHAYVGTQTYFSFRGVNRGGTFRVGHTDAPL